MADKPSRGLILYGDGLSRFIQPSHTHLHSLASIANCGFLSLPNSPPSESEDDRIVREFAVLVDAFEALHKNEQFSSESKSQNSSLIPSISERFMGMKAAILSNNSSLKSFGENSALIGDAAVSDVEFMNALLGAIMSIATPGAEVGSRLLLSLVMSYGYVSKAGDPGLSILSNKDEKNPHLSVLLPKQSYTMRGESPRNDVRPMLFAQYQYSVTRKDMVETFSFEDFKERSGNLTIPAGRMLHEVAFKLWKAPKYGA
ncbi:TMEM222 protein [Hibiscus syriacus]|uniref:TMEM222 protein n=1 Tax=Hibiscus syriacus TaxID=106335 RepID=A0A6A2YTH3_HIBSY|nr:TMEM222 protein [Hibiscus syriacus]